MAEVRTPLPHETQADLVALVDGEIVGADEVTVEEGEPAFCEIGVLPAFRCCGIGTRLLEGARQALGDMATVVQAEDVPLGTLTRVVRPQDVDTIRGAEVRFAERGWASVRALAHLDGEAVGYTEMYVNRHDPTTVVQDDTLVDRGRGVGRALKIANPRQLAHVPEAAASRWVRTCTSLGNEPRLAQNRAIGFRHVGTMTELEGSLRG